MLKVGKFTTEKLYYSDLIYNFATHFKISMITFDKILEDGRLWAVQYEDCPTNALQTVFDQWEDLLWWRD